MTSPAIKKYRKFTELLYSKTVEKEINWNQDFDDSISAPIGKNRICVFMGTNSNREDLVIFELYNQENLKADSFNDESLINNNEKPRNFDHWFSLCKAIYELGLRHATGADHVLDAMIETLDDDVPF